MQALDATTLLMVNAVFNGFAALAWCVLAGVFRIAPAASWLMAACHLMRIFSLRVLPGLPGWTDGQLFALSNLATATLLALALRRMLRLHRRWGDIAAVSGAAAGLVLALALAGRMDMVPLPAMLGIALLSLIGARDVLVGTGPVLRPATATLMALPYAGLALICLSRAGQIVLAPQSRLLVDESQRPTALMAGLWLLLTTVITVSLIALLIGRLISRIEHLTLRDPMTDALNRRAVAAEMQALQAHLERGHGYALVIIDIDHFKRINDAHGHAAGDAALLHFAAVMRAGLRDLDRLGRLGGEEFCVLLPHTSLAGAAQVAERLREALAQRPLHWRGRNIEMSASFGVAAGRAGDAHGEQVQALADRQVYRAKAEGRNRVCVAPAGEPAQGAPA